MIFKIQSFLLNLEMFTRQRKKIVLASSVFVYENRGKLPIFVSKNSIKELVDLLLIEKAG